MTRRFAVVAGVQKCGTSTLYRTLSFHPSIAASHRSETEFFTKRIRISGALDRYLSMFPSEQDSWCLDVSPGYFVSEQAPRQMSEVIPDARLIFILRNPIDRVFSAWRMQVTKGSDLRPFATALREERPYLSHCRYATHIYRYLEYFDRKQMLILFFDDLVGSAPLVFDQIAEFLGISPVTTTNIVANAGGIPRYKSIVRILNVAYRARNGLAKLPLVRWVVTNSWVDRGTRKVRNFIARWNSIPGQTANAPTDADRAYLVARLEDEMARLEELTGRSLSNWAR